MQTAQTQRLKDKIPQSLHYLANWLVARMNNEDAMIFYMRFLDVLDTNADLSKVEYKLKLWILLDPEVGIIKRGTDEEKAVIQYTAEFLRRFIRGEEVSQTERWPVMRRTLDSWREQKRFVSMSAVHWSVVPEPNSLMWVAVAVGEWQIIEYKRIADKLTALLEEAKLSMPTHEGLTSRRPKC